MARSLPVWVFAFLMTASHAGAPAPEEKPVGYLCCNMRTDGSWISDINYDENGKKIVPVGTPLKVTGYGHYRVKVDINGKSQAIGNDYSRDLDHGDLCEALRGCGRPRGQNRDVPEEDSGRDLFRPS